MGKDRPSQRPPSSTRLSNPGKRPAAGKPARKKRNPLEAGLVWGLIGALCVVGMIEGAALLSYNRAFNLLQTAVKEQTAENPLTIDAAKALVGRKPDKEQTVTTNGIEQVICEWRWLSLFKPKSYRIAITATTSDRHVTDLRTATSMMARERDE